MRFLMTIVIMLATTASYAQAPIVIVQGYTQFSEVTALKDGRHLVIEGRLKDDLGGSVPNQDVHLFQGQTKHSTQTNPEGKFTFRIIGNGNMLAIEYLGVDSLIGTRMDRVPIRERVPTIQVDAPETAAVDEEFTVVARLKSGSNPRPSASLILETSRTRTECTTDEKGRCQWNLSSPKPGRESFRVLSPGISPPVVSENTVEIQQGMTARMSIYGLMDDPEGAYLVVELSLVGPRPDTAVGAIRLNGQTIESRVFSSSTRFHIPWEQLRTGENIISAQARSEEPGWASVLVPEKRYIRPDQWVASRWPIHVVWGSLGLCFTLLIIRGYRKRQRTHRLPTPMPKVAPIAVFDHGTSVRRVEGFEITVVCGENAEPIQADVTACRDLSGAHSAQSHHAPGLDAQQTNNRGHLRLTQAPPAILVQSPNRVSVACSVPPNSRSVRVELWMPRGYAQRAFMSFLRDAGFPVLVFGQDTPREAGSTLKTRGYTTASVDMVVLRIEEICFGAAEVTIEDALNFERSVRGLASEIRQS